jgi:hypothetical protein
VLESLAPEIRRRCLSTLSALCSREALVPRSLELPPCYDSNEPPLHHGESADLWKGNYHSGEVAVKVLRVGSKDNLEKVKKVNF